jgi:hypothetical protein
VSFKSTYAQLKKVKPALLELIAEKEQMLVSVYVERDLALVKFAKKFQYQI